MQSARPPAPPAEGAFDPPEAPALRCPSCGAPAREGDRACAHCGSLLSTRRCVTCFALSPRDAEKCVRCGALLPAETLKPSAGSCPDCKAAFVSRQAGAAGFSECPRCGGLFLTRESFDAVVKDAATRERARLLCRRLLRRSLRRGDHKSGRGFERRHKGAISRVPYAYFAIEAAGG